MKAGAPDSPSITANACRAGVSRVVVAIEHLLDFVREHCVEILRHLDLSGKEIEPLRLPDRRRIERHNLDHRLAVPGDDKSLALGGAIDQPGQVRFGFVNIDGAHASSGVNQPELVYSGGGS